MPDLDELARFDPADFPPVVPAPEIRRRGDRMRRRRTALVAGAAVLAVALAVGTPVVALSGHGDDHVQPAPQPSEPPHGWLTKALDFPIDSRFPTPFTTEGPTPAMIPGCGEFLSSATEDAAVVSYTGESENRALRWLVVFKDQLTAEAAMAQARGMVTACPADGIPHKGGLTKVYAEVPVDLGTEDSYAWTEQVRHDDGLLSDLTYVQVARTGNAIYLESEYTSAGGDDVVAQVQQLLTRRSREPLSLLCVYAVDQCLDPYAPAPTDVVGGTPSSQTLTTEP